MIIRLVNDSNISESNFNKIADAVKYYVPLVTKAWNIPMATVEVGGVVNDTDWLVYVTEKYRHTGASGYHTLKNGVPVAYCSPKAAGRLFGTYIKALVVKGKTIHGELYSPGLVSVICHEVAEMLVDPYITTISSEDFKGRKWLIEVCDHVFGSYQVYKSSGTNCVLPDITTPAFYDKNGVGPYSLFNATVAPFIMTKKGYAYWIDANGKLTKV